MFKGTKLTKVSANYHKIFKKRLNKSSPRTFYIHNVIVVVINLEKQVVYLISVINLTVGKCQ